VLAVGGPGLAKGGRGRQSRPIEQAYCLYRRGLAARDGVLCAVIRPSQAASNREGESTMMVRIAGLAALGLCLALAPGRLWADEVTHEMTVNVVNQSKISIILKSSGTDIDNDALNKGAFGPETVASGQEKSVIWQIEHCPPEQTDKTHTSKNKQHYTLEILYTDKPNGIENVLLCKAHYNYNLKGKTCYLKIQSLTDVADNLKGDDPNNIYTPPTGDRLNENKCVDKHNGDTAHGRILYFKRDQKH
jgi:hypothetical protein